MTYVRSRMELNCIGALYNSIQFVTFKCLDCTLNVNGITLSGRILPGDSRRVEIREELGLRVVYLFLGEKRSKFNGLCASRMNVNGGVYVCKYIFIHIYIYIYIYIYIVKVKYSCYRPEFCGLGCR